VDDRWDFATTAGAVFPGARPPSEFVRSTTAALAPWGFSPANAVAAVAVCRDEVAQPFTVEVADVWGPPFSLAGLAGLVSAGRTGLSAAAHHSPTADGRRRLVVYALAHVGIGPDGTVGEVRRDGVAGPSAACGSLAAFRAELIDGTATPDFDEQDAEQSLLRRRLLPLVEHGVAPPLLDLTRLAIETSEGDLLIALRSLADADPGGLDAALVTGIQIHGPGAIELVWPRAAHVVVDREERRILPQGG